MDQGDRAMPAGVPFSADDPDNHCFGCSPHNERGLRMQFVKTGRHAVEARYLVPEHFCGAPQVVHGGIQATMLDEVLGYSCRTAFLDEDASLGEKNGGDGIVIVTAEFSLRYRIPVPTGANLVLRADVERVDGRNVFVKGAILDEGGRELTRGEARWVRLG